MFKADILILLDIFKPSIPTVSNQLTQASCRVRHNTYKDITRSGWRGWNENIISLSTLLRAPSPIRVEKGVLGVLIRLSKISWVILFSWKLELHKHMKQKLGSPHILFWSRKLHLITDIKAMLVWGQTVNYWEYTLHVCLDSYVRHVMQIISYHFIFQKYELRANVVKLLQKNHSHPQKALTASNIKPDKIKH